MKILTLKHKDSAVFKYRFDTPLINGLGAKYQRSIVRKGEKIRISELADRFKKKCDILVIKYIDDFYTLNLLYTMRDHAGFKIVVDIDDNLWGIPFGSIVRGSEKQNAHRAMMVAESIKSADAVSVSTEPLRKLLSELNEKIEVLPNLIDVNDWTFTRKKHDKVRIGWVWSPTHIPDNKIAQEPLKRIKEKYGDKVEIVIFGTDTNIFDFDTVNIPAVKYDKYPQTLTEAGIDISIGALDKNSFNDCKSNIKFLESTMAGAVFIGSDVYPYKHTVKHTKTGYIATSTNQWVKYISWMIDNPEKRHAIQESAKAQVLKNFTTDHLWMYKDFYTSL